MSKKKRKDFSQNMIKIKLKQKWNLYCKRPSSIYDRTETGRWKNEDDGCNCFSKYYLLHYFVVNGNHKADVFQWQLLDRKSSTLQY